MNSTAIWKHLQQPILALGICLIFANAYADCGPVLDAMKKAASQERVATYEVDDEESAPVPGEGTFIRIGNASWSTMDGKNFVKKEVAFPNLGGYQMFAELDRKGAMQCEQLGTGVYQGKPVVRYRFNNPFGTRDMPPELLKKFGATNEQIHKMTTLIDSASGLPVYSESYTPVGLKIGVSTVYGDAVKEPGGAAGK